MPNALDTKKLIGAQVPQSKNKTLQKLWAAVTKYNLWRPSQTNHNRKKTF